MFDISATLFGKFNIERGDRPVAGLRRRKVLELFSYLLIFKDYPQPRESLLELLWRNQSPAKSKKHLRQTLWHLQSILKDENNSPASKLIIDSDWIQINPSVNVWLDVTEFEQAFKSMQDRPIQALTLNDFQSIEYAVSLYKGDLLEGWYHDWCIFERERFQIMYLMLLDKLVQYCEIHQQYGSGLLYGAKILRQDRGYERAHRQLMRLYYMNGNRTQALHQYARCATALRDELGVEPSERTKALYEQIRSDQLRPPLSVIGNVVPRTSESTVRLNDVLNHLEEFAETLKKIESRVQQEIVALQGTLSERS
jgi:DNA-binding SARP family transcriptional activator